MAACTPAPDLPLLIHVMEGDFCADSPAAAIGQLAAAFAQQAALPCADALAASALQREAAEPTYIGKGMALPHARVAGLARPGICVAHSAAGVRWQAACAHLVIFIAVPEEQPELYLHLMGHLVRWRLRLADDRPTPAWEQELREALA